MVTPGFRSNLYHKFGLVSGDERSVLVKKNIYFSLLIKGFSISISLLLVPLTLNYLSVYEFGVWLTLSSVFTWINYFDIGLGHGLRNRLAESFAAGNKKLGQIYISTTFFILSSIVTVIFLIFLALQPFLDWSKLLNVRPTEVVDLNKVIVLSFAFFCINFVLKIVGIVYAAAQKPAINDLLTFMGGLLSLIVIFILAKTTEGTLLNVALAFSAAPVVILFIAYPITFFGRFSEYKPKFSAIKPYYARDLMNLGLQFFVLQLSGLVIFGTSNIIISRILGPEQVAPYNIAFRYFGIATMAFNIIITPMWSASTDAYAKGDLVWIKKFMKGMIKISIFSTLGVLVLILSSNIAYRLWIGTAVNIPFKLSIWTGIYTTIVLWSTCFSTFLFGIGKLRIQLINTLIASFLFIPLAIWLIKSMGITGIVIALCLTNFSGAILNSVQYQRIITGKATGIWNK